MRLDTQIVQHALEVSVPGCRGGLIAAVPIHRACAAGLNKLPQDLRRITATNMQCGMICTQLGIERCQRTV